MKKLTLLCLGSSLLALACAKDDGDTGFQTGSATATTSGGSGTDTASSGGTTATSGTGGTGTSTSGGTSTTGGTTGGSSGGGFITPPDGGGGANECDIWAQDCPAGEKCMPWANDGGNSWNALKCSPVDASPKQPGDPCTVEGSGVSGVDDCDLGAMCWDVDAMSGMGTCVSFCTGSDTMPVCSDPNTACTIYNDGVLPLCLPGCDPIQQDCANANVCVQTADGTGFVCVLDASGMEGQYRDPCEYVNACDPGLFCANAAAVPNCMGTQGCCTAFCDTSDPNANTNCSGAPDTECVPYFEMGMAPPGYENVGGCLIPP